MKLFSVLLILMTSTQVFAKADLNNAFEEAMKRSESDKNQSLTTINVEHENRMAAWHQHKKEVVVVPGTAAVDMPYSVSHSQTKDPSSQIDTEAYVKSEVHELK